jgi:hypothetical protein
MAKETKSEAKGRLTPSDLKTPSRTYADKMAILGGEPKKLNVEQIDKVNMPTGRGKAPGSVGF